MIHILKREFIDSFKSIRSILIISFITFVSYQSARFIDNNLDEFLEDIGGDENSIYVAVIAFIVLFLGFLFVFATSHDVVNKEIELGTMRLLVTKTSRLQIMLGKFLGTLFFWIVTFSISFIILSTIVGSWFLKDYFEVIIILSYIVSFVGFISTLIPNSRLTMFLGVFFGISLPIIGLISIALDKWYLVPFKYLLPYKYIEGSFGLLLIPLAISVGFFLLSVFIFQRRDL